MRLNRWAAALCNGGVAWIAFTLLVALDARRFAAFGFPEAESTFAWLNFCLTEPWALLGWAFAEFLHRPDLAALVVIGIGVDVLAVVGVLVIVGATPPLVFPPLPLRRGYASLGELRRRGLLRASGIVLGAVRGHLWEQPQPVSREAGRVLIVGDEVATGGVVGSAMTHWRGALVLVDGGELAAGLPRSHVLRFAPGRPDTVRFNPLLAIRGGTDAWSDAQLLARAFLGPSANPAQIDAFATLALDHLMSAPVGERCLAALRRRLANVNGLIAEMCERWGAGQLDAEPPLCELARTVQNWQENPTPTREALAQIDGVLGPLADGAYATATSRHQVSFGDLVIGHGPNTLVISPPPGEMRRAAPLIAAMLAQLVADCAVAPDIDRLGRPKTAAILVIVSAEAARALRESLPSLLPDHAARNGCSVLIEARNIAEAPRLAFDAIVAAGQQSVETADQLSRASGTIRGWRRKPYDAAPWRELFAPSWSREARPVIASADLTRAGPERIFLLSPSHRPVWARLVTAASGSRRFLALDPNLGEGIAQIPHDWNQPALPRQAVPEHERLAPSSKVIGSHIRKALAGPPLRPTTPRKPRT